MLFKLISKGFVYVLSIMNYGVMAYLHFLVDVSLFLGKTLVKRIYAPNFPFFFTVKSYLCTRRLIRRAQHATNEALMLLMLTILAQESLNCLQTTNSA